MELIHAIILGIVQGLTEFLPISSNAHLRIVPALLGWNYPQSTLTAFTAVIQLGTVLAVLIYFAKDLKAAIGGWAGSLSDPAKRNTHEAKMGWAVFVGTLPIIVLALVFRHQIKDTFRDLRIIAVALIVMSVVMFLAEKFGKKNRNVESVDLKDGVVVGLWQVLALIPGVSRSGSTISGGLFQGFDHAAAARFSFLMAVPSVTAAGIFEAVEARHELKPILTAVIVGTVVAFIVGYASIAWLMKFLQRRGIGPFVLYRIVLGVFLLVMVSAGKLAANAGAESSKTEPAASTNVP
ncbi:undecaprenyl-diphosphate phosphatase [Fimbriimonas ginsengisoli]|uniref:Undecaprenyl-diphosphatase n=1 Tax=Fimbriimonas ginsengisoli Gsoil 348 TaxID=661478 RepID=A0A068NSP7_FIMGI|nr:undecaprenyl-diphosphate phosphatase [Fimbriimonas ginsengisoli]AIE86382.1 undecaprenol kinase [Fimbriimonas ginsengisoli Gsoil 348]